MSHNPVATVFSAVLQDGVNGSPTLQQLVQPLNLLVASLNLKKYFIKTSFNIPYLFKLKHSTSKERPSQKRTHLEWAPILNKCPPWSSKKLISNHPFPPPLKKLHKSTWLQNFFFLWKEWWHNCLFPVSNCPFLFHLYLLEWIWLYVPLSYSIV